MDNARKLLHIQMFILRHKMKFIHIATYYYSALSVPHATPPQTPKLPRLTALYPSL